MKQRERILLKLLFASLTQPLVVKPLINFAIWRALVVECSVMEGVDQVKINLGVGLIGREITQSRTPAMHLHQGRVLGLNYEYERFCRKVFGRLIQSSFARD